MTAGELFLESLSSGVITQAEIDWLLSQQDRLSRAEQAAMQRLGRLLDQGQIQLGCRVAPHCRRHRQVLNEWSGRFPMVRLDRPPISAGIRKTCQQA